jgi:predicted Zn-dependent peptidase
MKLSTTKINSKLSKVTITINAGSASEEKISCEAGTAHYLEHMIFKGSENISCNEVSMRMGSLGAEMNAHTNHSVTSYYFEAPTENIDKCLEIFSDIIKNPLLREEDIEKERTVILEEEIMYQEDPASYFNQESVKFIYDKVYNLPIIGTKESISNINKNDLELFHKSFYNDKHMLISVVSSLSKDVISDKISKYFGQIDDYLLENKIKTSVADWSDKDFFIMKEGISQAHGDVVFKSFPLYSKEYLAATIVSMIMGDGMDSRLFLSVREEKGLVYTISATMFSDTDTGIMYISFLSTSPNEVFSEIDAECQKVIQSGFTEEEITRAKNKYKSNLYKSFESKRYLSSRKEKSILDGRKKVLDLSSLEKKINEVTSEDLLEVAKKIFSGKRISIVMNEK